MLFQYLLVVLIFLVIVSVRKRPKKLLDLHRQIKVSFPYVPVIGQAYKFMGSNEDRMMFMNELARESYKNKHSIVSLWLFNDLYVSISEAASASIVFKASSDKGLLTLYGRHLLGNGSVFGYEEIWRLRRKILTPMFAPKYFNNFVQVIETNNKIMMEKLAAVVGKGDFSIWEYLSSYTLDSALGEVMNQSISESAREAIYILINIRSYMSFGENVEAHSKQSFVEAIQDYCRLGAERVIRPWLCSTALFRLLPADARVARDKRLIWGFVETLIRKKKAALANERKASNNAITSSARRTTFLELLMKYSGGEAGYSDTELREETLVLVLAATDTTATAAGFAALLLARHPHVQDRVHRELRKILGDLERPVSVDDLAKLKYLDAVVRESMRLYPPVPVTLRKCNRDVELPSGLILHAGCVAMLNIWGVHRNPQCWGPDADEFRPERFLSATPDQLAAFMPFGHGPRSCTGTRLALASLKLTLAELTRRYRVAPATRCERSEPLRVTFEIMLKHVEGFKVRLEKRN